MHNQSTTTLAALHRSLALARRQAQALRGQATAPFLRAQSLRLQARAMQGAPGSVKACWIATQAEERAKVADEQARLAETAVDEALAKVADEQAGRAERVGGGLPVRTRTLGGHRCRSVGQSPESLSLGRGGRSCGRRRLGSLDPRRTVLGRERRGIAGPTRARGAPSMMRRERRYPTPVRVRLIGATLQVGARCTVASFGVVCVADVGRNQ